jgi:hypothetical protein
MATPRKKTDDNDNKNTELKLAESQTIQLKQNTIILWGSVGGTISIGGYENLKQDIGITIPIDILKDFGKVRPQVTDQVNIPLEKKILTEDDLKEVLIVVNKLRKVLFDNLRASYDEEASRLIKETREKIRKASSLDKYYSKT